MSAQREIVKAGAPTLVARARVEPELTPDSLRELAAVLFRNARLIRITFLSTLAGAILMVAMFGFKYEAETQVLVKHQRADEVASTDSNSRGDNASVDSPVEREINTEIALLKSGDLLTEVVKKCHLDDLENRPWNRLFPDRDKDWRVAKATRRLEEGLRVTEVPQSNLIDVSYRSDDPNRAAQVIAEVDRLYLAKHLAVNRPPGEYNFFHQQSQYYGEQLQQAEQQLASYDLQKDATDPDLDKEILLRKAGEFDGSLRETQADISQTNKRIIELSALLQKTPARETTEEKVGDNPQLLAYLKSNLAELETKRTDLLQKYQPTYPLVVEVNKQIADLHTAIAGESSRPVKEESTNQNPTYQLLQDELVKANEDLTSDQAKARAMAPIVDGYRAQARLVDQKGIQRQDLMRNIKETEANYLLYVQKQEQARISDQMDKDRILNVAVAEAPGVPSLPVYSPVLLIIAAAIVAVMISLAVAFMADYFDPSFRTPREIGQYLNLPLLATFSQDGRAPQFGQLAAGSGMTSRALSSGDLGRQKILRVGEGEA